MTLTTDDFQFVESIVRTHSGNTLADHRRDMVAYHLELLARQRKYSSVSDLIYRVRTQTNINLEHEIVSSLLNHETSFFRDVGPFRFLREYVEDLLSITPADYPLNMWSAGCSTGQEPYSMAMAVHATVMATGRYVSILASDLSVPHLERATNGFYSKYEVNRGLPAKMLLRYFKEREEGWVVREEIRNMVEFRRINLATPWPHMPSMDVVFLRNVLMYFDLHSRQEIVSRVADTMRPNGILFLGGSESSDILGPHFRRSKSGAYVLDRCIKAPGG